ncbi:MAG: LpqB family beta-propeller domain-containing protein [Terrimicrobiaceae bacterium]
MFFPSRRAIRLFVFVVAAGLVSRSQAADGAPDGKGLEAFTGSHTRVVWVIDENNKDTFAATNHLKLMGFDSRDGLGEREIFKEASNYFTPLLTPDGRQIVFTNKPDNKIYVVNWDGSDLKFLRGGAAADVWINPRDGRVWVYAQLQSGNPGAAVIRFLLEDPSVEETVWSSSPVQALSVGGFQVSRDGLRAASTFPWPNSGVAELPDVAWRKARDGCWPSMAPDNSYMAWTFDGPHKNLFLVKPGEEPTKIPISVAPGVGYKEVYHPRWSNDVRFFVMTGPYHKSLWKGGDGVEIYLGKFDENFTSVESWFQLTHTQRGDFFPDVWIADGEKISSKFERLQERTAQGVSTPPSSWWNPVSWFRKAPDYNDTWPVSSKGLVFFWEDNKSSNTFKNVDGKTRTAQLSARGGVRWGPDGEMHIVEGAFLPDEPFADEIRQACMETDELTIEAVVSPAYDLQGGPARIISFSQGIKRRNFTLGQEGNQLVLRLQTSETNRNGLDFNLAPIQANKPHHVIVSYKPGNLVCYVDGKIVSESAFESGTFQSWKDYELIFGKEHGSIRHWDGFLRNVAIYNRRVGHEEALLKYDSLKDKLKAREQIPTTKVRVKMLTREDPPPAEAIAPYRRALVINRYEVLETSDPALTGQSIQIAEWAMLDARVPDSYQTTQPGMKRALEIQLYDNHPQLESERLLGEAASFDDPLFYDVNSGR